MPAVAEVLSRSPGDGEFGVDSTDAAVAVGSNYTAVAVGVGVGTTARSNKTAVAALGCPQSRLIN